MIFWAEPLNDHESISLFQEVTKQFPQAVGTFRSGIYNFKITDTNNDDIKRIKKNSGNSIFYFEIIYGRIHIK